MRNTTTALPRNLVCFSHLRWDFVFQRPQHLLSRLSNFCKVFFVEEPQTDDVEEAFLSFSKKLPNLWVCVPHLPSGLKKNQVTHTLTQLFEKYFQNKDLDDFIFWYYTPMALEFTEKYTPKLTVYDCMDELSAFKFAPAELRVLEKRLMQNADIVFTGGQSLYEAKRNQHTNIYSFPSSIDKSHFEKARKQKKEPEDQRLLHGIKLGFYGVIDERFDKDLVGQIAHIRPDWQLVILGPIAKINPLSLPHGKNIHYLGTKKYEELPAYLSGWQVALIPFALNEATRFISPTKTPEYLAAGIPVVSTPIRDVVHPYADQKFVEIASSANEFVRAIERILSNKQKKKWLNKVDAFLATNSWDLTCTAMIKLINETLQNKDKLFIAS